MSKKLLFFDRIHDIHVWCQEHGIVIYQLDEDKYLATDTLVPFLITFGSEEDRVFFEIGYPKSEDRRITTKTLCKNHE